MGIDVIPLTRKIGAEVHGVDLSQPLSDAEFGTVHQALMDHQVIFFRDQSITPEQHLAFGRRFGRVADHFGPFDQGCKTCHQDPHAQKLLDKGMRMIRRGEADGAVPVLDALIAYCPAW